MQTVQIILDAAIILADVILIAVLVGRWKR